MRGLMMDRQLSITQLIQFSARYHANTEIVTRTVEGPVHRYTYGDAYKRVQQLAHALQGLGVGLGDRVATMAWNTHRHFELYYAISGIGAVCHTINPRLFPEQIVYMLNHAADKVVCTDITFVPLFEKLQDKLPKVEAYVVMTDRANMPETSLPNAVCYEDLIAGQPESFDWPEFDENTASSLCYTSGTTGNPKGALYSHRSTVLHSYCITQAEGIGITSREVILPVVPMFHVNAWGIPYGAAMSGAKLVFPGPLLDGASVFEMMDNEGVTLAAGVPTIWLMLLGEMKKQGRKPNGLSRMVVGGSAVPMSMIVEMEKTYGLDVHHAWGMTEMSPIGTHGTLLREHQDLPQDEQFKIKAKQGRFYFNVDAKIVDDDGNELPQDGKAHGELCVRGPWVIRAYYEDEEATKKAFTPDGWFKTGDVATIDERGYMTIVDRSKDVIKSGGEWISSIDLENAAMAHPDVAEAAVIGLPHPKWDERPLLVVVPEEGKEVTKDAVIRFLEDRVAKWWLPDDVAFVEELPHGATGKVSKLTLREKFQDYKLPTA